MKNWGEITNTKKKKNPYVVHMRFNLLIKQSLLQIGYERSRGNSTPIDVRFHDLALVGKGESRMSKSCFFHQKMEHQKPHKTIPDSCKYLYTRKLTSSLAIDMPQREATTVLLALTVRGRLPWQPTLYKIVGRRWGDFILLGFGTLGYGTLWGMRDQRRVTSMVWAHPTPLESSGNPLAQPSHGLPWILSHRWWLEAT